MKAKLTAIAVSSILIAFPNFTHAATQVPWVDNGVRWTHYYNPDVRADHTLYDGIPTDSVTTSPTWAAGSFSAGSVAEVSENFLRIGTAASDGSRTFRQSNGYDLGTSASSFTLEARFRVTALNADATYAGSFLFGTGTNGRWGEILYSQTSIGGATGLDLTDWTLVRFTITGATTSAPLVSIFVNGSQTANATMTLTAAATLAYFQIGDGSTASFTGGVSEWDYLRWTNEGAYAPIPEPSSLALFGVAALYAVVRRKK
jgi:hypothetical protein